MVVIMSKPAKLKLNLEADVSQDLNKRMIFYQAKNADQARVLVLNDVYLDEAKSILGDNAIFLRNLKTDLFLSHELIQSDVLRDALARAYRDNNAIQNNGIRSSKYISSFLLLLEKVATQHNEIPIYTLETWQDMSDTELIDDIEKAKKSELKGKKKTLVNTLIETTKKSKEGLTSFITLAKSIWKLHSRLNIKDPMDWIGQNKMVVMTTSNISRTNYGQLLYQFALGSGVELYLDTLVPTSSYFPFLASLNSNMCISLQSGENGSEAKNIAYRADELYASTQTFDVNIYVCWLAKNYPKLLEHYSLDDFTKVFRRYEYAGYLNSYLGAEEEGLVLFRLNENNTLENTRFTLTPILEKIQNQGTDTKEYGGLKKAIDNLVLKVEDLESKLDSPAKTSSDSSTVDDEFEKALRDNAKISESSET